MKTKQISRTLLVSAALLAFASSVGAAVIQTFGTGSAVSTVTNSADFELNLNLSTPYSEGGMVFTYNGSSDNNGCGYAGCTFHSGFYPGFSGNYMYSVGTDTFISITMGNGSDFSAIEFAAGSGFGGGINGYWQTYNNSVMTGFGNFTTSNVDVLGLADSSGFDEVRYFTFPNPNQQTGTSAPAIDTVRAGSGGNSVPEPASLALLGIGLVGLGAMRRRKA
jgi:hypothetical protein